jgi:hypothetical protein
VVAGRVVQVAAVRINLLRSCSSSMRIAIRHNQAQEG